MGHPPLTWTYDRYGNRTAQSISSGCTGVTCPMNTISVSTTTNRITDSWAVYDSNGNMTNDGSNTLSYDAENQMVSAAGRSYAMDGLGLRVRICTPNCTSPTSNTVYIFNGAQVIAEYDNGAAVGSPTREYIYNGSQLLAKFESGNTTYYHRDHLSNRLTTNSTGSILGEFGYFPFGESCYSNTTEPSKWRFTSYERDTETGNDYAIFRSYVNRLGRFSSPDPIAGSVQDPQSHNSYVYVTNDPVNSVDPLGLIRLTTCAEYSGHPWCVNLGPDGPGRDPSPECTGRDSSCSGSGGPRQQPQPPPPPPLQLRQPGETVSECINRVGSLYSAAGIFDLAAGTNIAHTTAGEIVAGNDVFAVAGLLGFGPESGLGVTPEAAVHSGLEGVGTPTTIGGNGANRIERLFVNSGRPAQAVLRTRGVRQVFNFLKGAKSVLTGKTILDIALAGAAALNCSLPPGTQP